MSMTLLSEPGRGLAEPLSPPQASPAEAYREQGFLVVEGLLGPAQLELLRTDLVRICRGHYGRVEGEDQSIQAGMFAENLPDDEVIRQFLCIHFAHKLSPVYREALALPGVVEILTQVIGPNVKCMQSMLFIKAAGKPGQAWHQDEYYIPTRDRSLTGAWMALDDATVDNGCLWVIPGSHRPGVLWPQRAHGDSRFDCAGECFRYPYREEDAIAVEMKAGSVVFFNGYLLHRSLPNTRASGFRRSLVNHYMSAESLLPWRRPEGTYGMGQADFRDIVMVAGTDPYAYKGIDESLHRAHIRRSGEGGCVQPARKPPAVSA